MDYKYIEQLLERYWECQTSLEEENILRTFFSQEDVPGSLLQYKALFCYEQQQKEACSLGDDFDERILGLVEQQEPVKARTVTMRQRLMPLFRAAAIVAIILTLGNALQMAFDHEEQADMNMADMPKATIDLPSVARTDTLRMDSVQQAVQAKQPHEVIIK